MRFYLCLMVVAVAGAIGAQEHAERLERVKATEFGATVLADLQDRLNVAEPIDALREFIGKIRSRIENDAQVEADAQDTAGTVCLKNLGLQNHDINETIIVIDTQTAIIARQSGIIKGKIAAIISKKIQIRDTQRAIVFNQNSIEEGDKLRSENAEAFKTAAADAVAVRAAIRSIQEIEGASTLSDNQDETTDSIYGDRQMNLDRVKDVKSDTLLSVKALSKLQAVAAQVTDSTAQSFVQLAALSSQAFGGDVGDLKALFATLIKEVDAYAALLQRENAQNVKDWATLKATMEAEILDWEADLVTLGAELLGLQKELQTARDLKSAAVLAYNAARKDLSAAYDGKASLLKACSDGYDAYVEGTKERKEELETLQLIFEIIKDKLADPNSSIKHNVNEIMSGGQNFVPKCHCDHACGVFEDCCPVCDVAKLSNVPSRYDNVTLSYVGGEKELPVYDARTLYSQYGTTSGNGGIQ